MTRLNQQEALKIILRSGRRYTMTQLVEQVSKKTRRTVKHTSLSVQLSHLRAKGLKIKTLCGKTMRDGITRYTLLNFWSLL